MFNRFFKTAIANATRSHSMRKHSNLSSFHGAVIVAAGKVLSVGVNKDKRNGLIAKYAHHENCNTHTECDAILRVRKKINLTGAKIYVAYVRRDGNLGNSKPCTMCTRVLQLYGITRAYYTVDNNTYAVMKL